MELHLLEEKTGLLKEGVIEVATFNEMPRKRNGWQFNWRSLAKTEGARVHKCVLRKVPEVIQGLIMLTIMNNEMVVMKNVEIAPHNYGPKGQYNYVAGGLIAFSCLESMKFGKGAYKGYVSFEAKTELIQFYHDKYGASWAGGTRMFFDPKQGARLISKYLK